MNIDSREGDFLPRKKWLVVFAGIIVVLVVAAIILNLRPVGAVQGTKSAAFKVSDGESFSEVAKGLAAAGLIRSRLAFEVAAIASGGAFHIQPGTYAISVSSSSVEILRDITGNGKQLVNVTIPEGSNIYQIDEVLAESGVISRGALIAFKDDGDLEGRLFPDTYQFFKGSDIATVVQKFLDNFSEKAEPLLQSDGANAEKDLVMASMLEKEVPDPSDQKMVAGILEKRMASGMRLQLDATVCYAKQVTEPNVITDCSALLSQDFGPSSIYNSDYNTYLHKGLPLGPIGNPGISAITAAMHPVSSSYLYYLSDPATGKTIYAKTLAQQDANIKKYLNQ